MRSRSISICSRHTPLPFTKTSMRGFVVTGPDETLSHAKTTAFANNYEAQLEFTILDQPL